MKKKLLVVAALLVVLVVAVFALVLVYLDPLVKKGVESGGSMITQVDVRLASANVNPMGGQGSLKGLVVGNPPGYKSDAAMKLGEISLAVAPGSLFADKVHIKSIAIIGPEINLEGGLKDNNLSKILANVQSFSGPAGTNQTDTATQKKLQLDSFVIRGAKVSANLSVPGLQPMSLTLPDLELSNLGQGPEGITAGELTARVINLVTTKALAAAVDYYTSGAGKQVLDNATAVATDAAKKAAGDAADKALKGVGDLLKKK
jgi:uncharacterized protein involved in outer membrane biogenesis